MTPFRFALLTLSSFRLTYLIVKDDFPPTKWLREAVQRRTGRDSGWTMLMVCSWCMGTYWTAGVFLTDRYLWSPPTWLLGMVAAMSIVGILGSYAERE